MKVSLSPQLSNLQTSPFETHDFRYEIYSEDESEAMTGNTRRSNTIKLSPLPILSNRIHLRSQSRWRCSCPR